MFCPNCGTQNDDNGVKCQKCGFNLKGAAAPKFKGTMLMMNSPVAQSARPIAPAGVPGQAPWPKSVAKATMIGVAPPSPGAVAPPPPAKSPLAPPVSGAPVSPAAPMGQTAPIPRPIPPGAPAGVPVNPFGGTMLMGAVPMAQSPGPAALSAGAEPLPKSPPDRTFASEGAPPPEAAAPVNLESTTPSVAPAPPGGGSTQNPMPAFVTADTAPPPGGLADAVAPEFPKSPEPAAPIVPVQPWPAPAAPSALRTPKMRPIGLVVALGFATFGIYWMIALYGALSDLASIRQKNDINPIMYFIPILGLLELLKLPKKVEETRAAVGVTNTVAPNLVLYLLFPQIFFIADLNEIVEATTRRNSLS